MPEKPHNIKPNMKPSGNPMKGLLIILQPYRGVITLLVVLTIFANALNLIVPKLVASAIDNYTAGGFSWAAVAWQLGIVAIGIFVFSYAQSLVQTIAGERVARDLRTKLILRISQQNYHYTESVGSAKLLTNLTSDVDAIKSFVANAIASLISSVFLIVGASWLLLSLNWRLGLAVLAVVPVIGFAFFYIFSKVRELFKISQEAIDMLNKTINESILGATIIRIVNAGHNEYQKFLSANDRARSVSLRILMLFATLVPIIGFATNLATVVIVMLGGHFVLSGAMTLGDFTAFNSYLSILIFPILIIGFMSNVIAAASASYKRISEVLDAPESDDNGIAQEELNGNIDVSHVSLICDGKPVLKDISFSISSTERIAIVGPTAAGKTQLLYLLVGLSRATDGVISYEGRPITEYERTSLYRQIGFVFQDSSLFNMTLRENIAFGNNVTESVLVRAIETAELNDFITGLPNGLDTIVSEHGTTLSGGQRQRVMLARALAQDPRILFLDDFTARVDNRTEEKILRNLRKNYPNITLVSVTQKIASVEHYDKILVLMEGELLASGTHTELLQSSPEYVQVVNSQQSTEQYETVA